ncbi:MAG TPA: cation:proton antiporter [Candidatus Cloacimonetes bacterium]|nr:cation:proton antiporter [Candidatus Cloacimonadota bacterium]
MALLELIKATFASHIIFSVSIILLIGYIFGQLAERINLPAITGYIIAGVLLGESGMQVFPPENIQILNTLSEVTLSFIAVIIGAEFSFQKLRMYGKEILILTTCQLVLTFLLVSFGLLLVGLPNYTAFVLGAISAATAPAATVAIIEKLKIKGKFVDYLYGIVALDDAGTVILFSIIFAISTSMMGQAEFMLSSVLWQAFSEIICAMIIGSIAGALMHFTTYKKKNMSEIKILALGFMFLSTAVSISLKLSPLIANMVLGLVLINLSPKHTRIVLSFEPYTNILYAIFFTVAGVELQMKVFSDFSVLLAGIVCIVMRMIGKYFGVFLGGAALKTDKHIRNYLGIGLFPQAGVAIGLVLFVQGSPLVHGISPEMHLEVVKMINIVLMSVFVNEILGPPLAKHAILKSIERR